MPGKVSAFGIDQDDTTIRFFDFAIGSYGVIKSLMTEATKMSLSNFQFNQFLRLSFILAGLHAAAMVFAFLVFGLGLEGPQNVGQKILPVLAQPMISLIPADTPAIVQNSLVFVSSLIWGGVIAGVICLCRSRKVNSSAMTPKHNA
ncbi:hypothetical protein [Haloferula sp.]|uniref:hypothetical protein n=1 Tax=Haloferula sp. TaxID=2497595 RepID=UPI00329E1785